MFEKLKTYLLFGNTYCGIEHHGKSTIEAILLQKQKNTLEVINAYNENAIETISKKLPKKQHTFLVINNDEVLSKYIENVSKDDNQLLYNAFPSVSKNDFYYEIHSAQSNHLVSICRKSYIDKLIETYLEYGIQIVGFSLGNSLTAVVNDFIKEDRYFTSNATITKENEVLSATEFTEYSSKQLYDINGIDIQNSKLLSFAGALSYILQREKTTVNFEEKIKNLLQAFKEKRFFSQFFIFGLGLILLLLLINFFVFNSYFQEVELMKKTSQVNVMQKDKLLQLKLTTDEKQKTVDDILKNTTSKSSYYIDNIALSLPKTIQLSALDYQPITKRIKKDKPILLKESVIVISGISTDNDFFSNWIKVLENFDWVKSATVVINGTKGKNNTDFSVTIQMKNE